MPRYSLRHPEGSCSYYKIMQGRRWVGRVYRHGDGSFVGRINGVGEVKRASAIAAFEDIAAQALGFASASAVRANNRAVRQQRKQAKQDAEYVFREILHGNFNPLDELLGFKGRRNK